MSYTITSCLDYARSNVSSTKYEYDNVEDVVKALESDKFYHLRLIDDNVTEYSLYFDIDHAESNIITSIIDKLITFLKSAS